MNYTIKIKFFEGLSYKELSYDFEALIDNGAANQMVFYNENDELIDLDILISRIKVICAENMPAMFYAKKQNASIQIIILNEEDLTLAIVPQKPFCLKQNVHPFSESFDLGFYMEMALGLCDNFAIYELSTERVD